MRGSMIILLVALMLLISSAYAGDRLIAYMWQEGKDLLITIQWYIWVDKAGFYLPEQVVPIQIPPSIKVLEVVNSTGNPISYTQAENLLSITTNSIEYGEKYYINITGVVKNGVGYLGKEAFVYNPFKYTTYIEELHFTPTELAEEIEFWPEINESKRKTYVRNNESITLPCVERREKEIILRCDMPKYFVEKGNFFCDFKKYDFERYTLYLPRCEEEYLSVVDKFSKNIFELSKIFNVNISKLYITAEDPRKMPSWGVALINYPNISFNILLGMDGEAETLQTFTHEAVHAFMDKAFPTLLCKWFSEGNAEFWSYELSKKFYDYAKEFEKRNKEISKLIGNIPEDYLSTWSYATGVETQRTERDKYDLAWAAIEEINRSCPDFMGCFIEVWPEFSPKTMRENCDVVECTLYLCCGDLSSVFSKYGISTSCKDFAKYAPAVRLWANFSKTFGYKPFDLRKMVENKKDPTKIAEMVNMRARYHHVAEERLESFIEKAKKSRCWKKYAEDIVEMENLLYGREEALIKEIDEKEKEIQEDDKLYEEYKSKIEEIEKVLGRTDYWNRIERMKKKLYLCDFETLAVMVKDAKLAMTLARIPLIGKLLVNFLY